MIKIKKLTSLVLALVMCLALAVPAMAASYDSATKTHGIAPNSYNIWSTLYVDGSQFRAATWVEKQDGRPTAANNMGADACLIDASTGDVRIHTGMQYNSSNEYFIFPTTRAVGGSSASFYSRGAVKVYAGDGFDEFNAPQTETQGRSILSAKLLATLDSNGAYPTNAHGHTYGSLLLSDVVGDEPDLIAAEGTNGVHGYLLAHDLNPDLATPEDATAYMETFNDHRVLPLYDANEAVIGTFVLEPGIDPNSSEFAACDLAAARAKVESGAYAEMPSITQLPKSPKALAALASQSRSCYYPENDAGQTYGTLFTSSIVGHRPDLIAVITTDGKSGYVLRADFAGPRINTPEEANAYMRSPQSKSALVPAYDSQGHEIGQFLSARDEFIRG